MNVYKTSWSFIHKYDLNDTVILASNADTKRENNVYRVRKVLVDISPSESKRIVLRSNTEEKDYSIKYELEAMTGIINSLRVEPEENLIQVQINEGQ